MTFQSLLKKNSLDESNIKFTTLPSLYEGEFTYSGEKYKYELGISGNKFYKDIGSGSTDFTSIKVTQNGIEVFWDNMSPITGVAALNHVTKSGGIGYGFPVMIRNAKKVFNATYAKDNLKTFGELSKLKTELGTDKAIQLIQKKISSVLDENFRKIEGSLFFDNTQQKQMKRFKSSLESINLNIDTETRSVLEFSGSTLSTEVLDKLIRELKNGSYYI